MSSILSTEQVAHSFNDSWLFKNLTFGIVKGQKLALVGHNGAGKSTFLKILAGKIIPQEGKVVTERDLKIGYLDQDPDFKDQETIADFIYSMDNKQQLLIRQYEELLSNENPDQDLLEKLTNEISELNAWEYEYEIKTILGRLSINNPELKINTLSGGQKKRLALAKLLIDTPDIYILDEPTNHLDIEMIEWLESFLTNGNKTVLMVTHDRYFLDAVCNQILELQDKKLYFHKGNYSYYLEKKAEREEQQASELQKNTNLLRKELEWMRRQPQARTTKSRSRINAFYELEEKTKGKGHSEKLELSITTARQGNKILELRQVSKSFNNKTLIKDFSYAFKKGDKIGIAGRNGTGKTTLLNLITGKSTPDSGEIIIGETTVFGYYQQSGLEIKPDERVIDVVKNVAEYIPMATGKSISASQLLTQFLFPPSRQYSPVNKLSGGERKRLQLMRVLMANPNFLILDEPTNDLDIDTLNVLEDFLENYKGVLLLVSHDRYLIDKLTEQLFILEGNEKVRIYSGNYTEYRIEKQDALVALKEKELSTVKKATQTNTSNKVKLSYKEQKEFELLDTSIPELENKITELSEELNSGITDVDKLLNIAQDLEKLKTELDDKTLRWIELVELKEG
ncbi:ABC-F family ATP-binding cassette domain-containing protein [Rubrolithibacter danxiaensis]|uniref:ABC-F family ATP-binding cassette domain-containing protein n=1 Tax=Rubrolithibacter danxiaensis TaxID=3390805 RepID=UPI003BF80A46